MQNVYQDEKYFTTTDGDAILFETIALGHMIQYFTMITNHLTSPIISHYIFLFLFQVFYGL